MTCWREHSKSLKMMTIERVAEFLNARYEIQFQMVSSGVSCEFYSN
jgi:hypothetical protein